MNQLALLPIQLIHFVIVISFSSACRKIWHQWHRWISQPTYRRTQFRARFGQSAGSLRILVALQKGYILNSFLVLFIHLINAFCLSQNYDSSRVTNPLPCTWVDKHGHNLLTLSKVWNLCFVNLYCMFSILGVQMKRNLHGH